MTDSPVTVHQAITAVMGEARAVAKGDRNTAQNFSFRGIDAVLNAVGPAMRTHGVFPVPRLLTHESEVVETGKNKTPMRAVTLTVEYAFYGPAGDCVTAVVPGEAFDSGDKAFSKAMSVALRTALIQTLALPTDDRDPDADTHERSDRAGAPAQRQAAPPAQKQPERKPANSATTTGAEIGDEITRKRREAWTRASNAAKALGMSRDEFADDFNQTMKITHDNATGAQLNEYAKRMTEIASANKTGANA